MNEFQIPRTWCKLSNLFITMTKEPTVLTVAIDDFTIFSGPMSATLTLTINLEDVNDNSPSCTQSLYSTSVQENATVGMSLETISCSDIDEGLNGQLNYIIASVNGVNTASPFAIHAATGVVSLDDTVDYEASTSYKVVVTVADSGIPAQSSTVTLTVQVLPINEDPPEFSPANLVISIPENSPIGYTVHENNATDADAGDDGVITYSITSGDTDKFAIDLSSGVITTSGELDRESVDNYVLEIQATDGGSDPGKNMFTILLTSSCSNLT